MKIISKNQQGMTFISWVAVIAVVIIIASALIKLAPHYIEYNSVRSMMNSIAAESGIKKRNSQYVYKKVYKYLNVNGLYNLEKITAEKKPFKISTLKKGKDRKKLSVSYEIIEPWLANIAFKLDFKYAVVLGEPK